MRIRKFEAATVQQAIGKVKAELGESAVILHTRTLPGKFFGLLGKPRVEVTAAVEEQQQNYETYRSAPKPPREKEAGFSAVVGGERPSVNSSTQEAAREFLTKMQSIRAADSVETSPAPSEAPREVVAPAPAVTPAVSKQTIESTRFEKLEVRFEKLANTMDRLLSMDGPLGHMGILADAPEDWRAATRRLLGSNLSEEILTALTERLQSLPHPGPEMESKVLREALGEFIHVSPAIAKPESGQEVIALIGPTGVGKTTTLAKLASGLVVNGAKPTRVALITVDTYRLAAVEQLETYAKILNLELHVVYGPEEMPKAIEKFRDADVIFVDTAGRSPRDDAQMEDLRSFLEKVPGCKKYLVLSSTMNDRYLRDTVERFRRVDIDSLIVTKLDETQNFAAPLNIHHQSGLPLSYLTTGQSVPEDIEVVEPAKLADGVLDEIFKTPVTEPVNEGMAQPALV